VGGPPGLIGKLGPSIPDVSAEPPPHLSQSSQENFARIEIALGVIRRRLQTLRLPISYQELLPPRIRAPQHALDTTPAKPVARELRDEPQRRTLKEAGYDKSQNCTYSDPGPQIV
jgi:hypothetical protein